MDEIIDKVDEFLERMGLDSQHPPLMNLYTKDDRIIKVIFSDAMGKEYSLLENIWSGNRVASSLDIVQALRESDRYSVTKIQRNQNYN